MENNNNNNNNNNLIIQLILVLGAYLIIKYLIPNGRLVLYPINLLVTYLHEFGHAFGSLITGGEVLSLKVNQDGSGLCTTRGGNRAIILMGGYIGSAIFGNALFYIGMRKPTWSRATLVLLSGTMVLSAFWWYSQPFTTGLLIAFSVVLLAIAILTNLSNITLMFIGLASLIHIIEDFNVGPTSDLEQYAKLFVVVPPQVWMYVWLIIVIILLLINLRMIFRSRK